MSRRHPANTTSSDSDSHFAKMAEWLALESEAEMARMAERQKELNSSQAERSGDSILDLAIVDHESGLGGRHLVLFGRRNRTQSMPWHRLRVGSPVAVSTFHPAGAPTDQDTISPITGVVSGRSNDSIQVALGRWPDGVCFRIDLTADEITRRRQLSAIHLAKDAGGRLGQLRQILMGERAPEFSPLPDALDLPQLNDSQRQAVEFALSAHDLAIIHGPPGTGKTTTVVELIVQAIQRGEKVLACAPSNTAVDNLLERLVAGKQKAIRVGHPARVTRALRDHTLDSLVDQSEEMKIIRSMQRESEQLFRQADRYTRARPERGEKSDLKREAKRLLKDARLLEKSAVDHLLDQADVICATTNLSDDIMGQRHFDLVVIDEACQSTEPGCWVPLLRGQRLVLAGDHRQLPPTILSTDAARDGFDISMMERAIDLYGDEVSRLLDVQYRMNDQIMRFSSQQFYNDRLKAHPTVQHHLLSDLPNVDDNEWTREAITFIDSAGANWDEEPEPQGRSRTNPQEAKLILRYAERLVAAGLPPRQIAVIAPYAGQVRLMRLANSIDDLEIDTIDGFQGREKEAVIISMVRSNSIGEIGFLSDARRMNVALTRARRKLLVVGDSSTLGHHDFFQEMLTFFEQQGAYRSVWQEEID